MKRFASDKTTRQPKPVKHVEIHEGRVKLRTVLLIAAILVAVGAFVYGAFSLMQVEDGWREITVTASEIHVGGNFQFTYDLGAGNASALEENRALGALYSKAAMDAYRIFNSGEEFEGLGNLYTLNAHINAPVQLEPALYQALQQPAVQDSRYIYLGPAYEEYNNLFFSTEDWEAENFDPYLNEDSAELLAQIAAFARDPEAVHIEFLGDNTAKLHVSEAYQSFAQENGITAYVALGWMQDAFVIDYLADVMEKSGFTRGAISSFNGFVRCLSEGELSYSYSLYDPVGAGMVVKAAQLNYPGGTALVHLHSVPLNTQRELYHYRYADGALRLPYADLADGKTKAALPALIATSSQMGCVEVLMRALPCYAADQVDPALLGALPWQGVYPLYCLSGQITSTDPSVTVDQLAQGYTLKNAD